MLDTDRLRGIEYTFPRKEFYLLSSHEDHIVREISRLRQEQHQVWVRVRPRSGGPHWRRAAVIDILGRQVKVKPIKHGGREELVPASDVKLWKAMNSKQVTKET